MECETKGCANVAYYCSVCDAVVCEWCCAQRAWESERAALERLSENERLCYESEGGWGE